MKKVLKIAGGIIGGYAILNTVVLAWVGAGRLIKRCYDHPNEPTSETFDLIVDETVDSWRPFIDDAKNLIIR